MVKIVCISNMNQRQTRSKNKFYLFRYHYFGIQLDNVKKVYSVLNLMRIGRERKIAVEKGQA